MTVRFYHDYHSCRSLIGLVSTLIRSTFEFGEDLVAVPLLSLLLPLQVALPVAVLLSIVVALLVIIQDHRQIQFQQAKWLVLSALPGIPVGLWLMVQLDNNIAKSVLGVLICAFSIYSLCKTPKNSRQRQAHEKKVNYLLYISGLLSGILGGACGLNGPPLVYYGINTAGQQPSSEPPYRRNSFLPASQRSLDSSLKIS